MAIVRINTGAVILLFLPLFISNVVDATGLLGSPSPTEFNVLKYGATPNGKDDSSEGIMQAWIAACHFPGGNAKLVIPQGTFLTGPVIFHGPCTTPNIVVELQGTLKASTDISEYSDDAWLMFEVHPMGLVLTGGGTVDGQGQEVWKYDDCHTNPDCVMLTTSIKFSNVNNGVVRGINLLNSQGFHMLVHSCNNFKAQNLHITAPKLSPNTDGIHISLSTQVEVSSSIIGTGDDCVSIGEGAMNVTVANVTCGPGHGISIGSLGKRKYEKDVIGVTVTNCTLIGTDNGVRVKTWPNSPVLKASHFIFEDIIMENVKNPIIIDQSYCGKRNCHKKPSNVAVSDVHFRNIKGTSVSNVAVNIGCSTTHPCQNVDLFNIDLKFVGLRPAGAQASGTCANAHVKFSGTQNPPPCQIVA